MDQEKKVAAPLMGPPENVEGTNGTNGNGIHYVPAPQEDRGILWAAVIPARYMFAFLAAISFAIIYGLKVNLSVAIVAMVNATAVHHLGAGDHGDDHEAECPKPEGGAHGDVDGPFVWDEALRGHILGSYFYGYLVAQIPGALLADRFSAKWVMFGAVLANVVGCALTPPACHGAHHSVFLALRVIQGAGAGVTFPAMHIMIANWAPPKERSLIAGVVYAGTALGTVGSTLMAGFLAAFWGWEWVFYSMALLSVPWFIFWAWWVADSPSSAKYISRAERDLITGELGTSVHGGTHLKFPVRAVFTSLPFWAILVAHFCSNCGWYMILTQLPSFMKHVLQKNIKENAGMSAIPYFLMWVVSIVLGYVLDTLRNKGKITTGGARKIATAIASVIPAACLVGISFIKCDANAGTALIIVAVTSIGAMFVGYLANHIDIAPNFAGMLIAITNTVATVPGIIMPLLIGILTEESQTLRQWSIAFYVTAALYVVMLIFYTLCGSGEEQPWNKSQSTDKPVDEERIKTKEQE